jgi:hypothetical protein
MGVVVQSPWRTWRTWRGNLSNDEFVRCQWSVAVLEDRHGTEVKNSPTVHPKIFSTTKYAKHPKGEALDLSGFDILWPAGKLGGFTRWLATISAILAAGFGTMRINLRVRSEEKLRCH